MGSSAATVWQSILYKNNTAFKLGTLINISSNYQESLGACMVQLASNDYIELWIYANASIAIGGTTGSIGTTGGTFLNGFLVSAT